MSNLIRVFVLLFGVLIYSQDTLSVKDGAYGYDQEFKLDVNLKTESDIKALQFDLNFDENNFTYASTYSLYKDRLGTDSDHTITVKKVSDSKIRVLIYSPSNKPFDKGDGKLVDFDFKNSINYGDYSFSVTNVVASLVDNSSANLILVNGTIRTKAPGFWKQYSQVNFGSIYKGSTDSRTLDLQNTGNSDLTITLVKNELSKFTLKDSSGNDVEWPIVLTSKEDSDNGIGNWSYQLVFGFEADANGKYEEVISFTTDEPKNDTVHEIKVTATVYNENKLVVKSNSDVYNDQESKINVEINGDEPITSFQFDITPTNSLIGLVDSSAKLLNTTTDHVISSKVLSNSEGENYLRVISYSPSNSVFTQPIGDIVEFKILPSGLNPGDYGLLISNAVLTNGGLVDVTSSTENGTIYIKAPKFDFSPAQEYNLGEVLRNTNDSHNFSIQNQGSLKLTISSITSTDPNLFISTSVPIEIETGSEQIINFDLLPTSDDSDYSSKIIVEHNAAKKSDTLKVLANIESRNTVKLTDAVYANAITKNIPLELLNSDKVKGLQFDLTFPEESKSISYTLTADGSSNYVFAEKDNAKDPDLVVYVGDKINFINNAGSTHPLFIVTNNESGYDKSNELSSGVTNQGADSGTLILDLSNLLPGTYYYICGNHKSMTGKITVLPKFSLTVDNTDLVSDRATGFNVSQSLLEARKYRVLLYSDTNSTFTGNIGNIMNIPITVSDITDSTMQISDGTYPILIDNIVISGSDNTNITSIPQTSSKAVFTTVNLFSPVVESNQSVSINENPTADVFFYTVIASDSDDNSFVNDFKITSGNDSGTFGISSNTGELYVKVPSDIDYESVQSYALGVTASDGTKTSAIEIVTVSVIDDPNVFVTEDLTVAIYRDNTDSGIITDNYNNLNNHKTSGRSSNSDDTQKVIYSVDDGVDKEFFSINSSSGELSFISAPSFANPLDSNKDNVYEVTLKAQNIDDTSEDLPVVSSRKSISILENNSAVTSVTTFISQAQSDLDGDGIIDTEDICPTIANPGQEDSDGNGEGDACQDTDGDGVLDKDDICPIIVNPGQEDSDGNGIGDVCEDTDGDGVSDTDDNCPLVANPGQEDLNNNNIGDVCEFGPVAVANTLTVNEDATLISTNVISNDTEQDGDTLSLTAVSTDGTGTVAVNSDGLSVDYTPAANFNGTETITYTVSDGALSANGTFTITVTAVNDAPVAVANTLTVDEDSSISNTDVIANDTDVEDDTLTLTAVSTDGTGTVAVNSDGLSVDYTPAANFNGTETITYTVSDGALSANGTFTITVTAVNDAPVAVANTLTVDEDSSISNTDVIANDTDVEDDTLTLTAVSTDGTGTVAVNSDGLSVDYTPAANFNGTETITYTVSDGTDTSEGTFTITVTAVNDAPVAVANTLTVDEDSSISNTDVIANDTDVEDDTLTLTAVSTDGTGTVAVNSDGLSVDYTPAANFNGTETITYTVSDGALSANGTFTITVTAVNDAPVAVANTLTVDEDSSISNTDVIANDTDVEDDTLTLTAVSTDGTGTVAVNSDGLSVDYTPAANFNGTETITYTVSDGTDTSAMEHLQLL